MIRAIAIFFFAFLATVSASAQAWEWGRGSIGNNIRSWPVAADPSGNAYVAGVSQGAVSFDSYNLPFATYGSHCVLAKYDIRGDFLWARSTQNDVNTGLINIAADKIGNCYLLGWMSDTGIVIGSSSLHNTAYPAAQYFVAKFDPEGNVLWAKSGGSKSGALVPAAVTFDNEHSAKMLGFGAITTGPAGDVYVTTVFNLASVVIEGHTLTNKDTTGVSADILMVKYDATGNLKWVQSSGGAGEDVPCGIAVTPAGSVYIAGYFNSDSIIFGPSVIKDTATGAQQWNAFIARFDGSGSPVWACSSGGEGKVLAAGIASDASNNVYLTGGSADSFISFSGTTITDLYPGKPILYLVKFDSSNNVDWYKAIGSPAGGAVWGYSVATYGASEVWVGGALIDEVEIDGHMLTAPASATDPVFIAGFDYYGNYIASGALQSGSDGQVGISCDGSIYLCGSYKYPCSPFIIAADVLATVPVDEKWSYLAKYDFLGSGDGPDTDYHHIDISECPDDSLALTAPSGFSIYLWDNGSTDTLLPYSGAGIYWVMSVGNNQVIFDTFAVTSYLSLCNCKAAIPDAFTPNGDGRNDKFGPLFEIGCSISKYAFSIFNRWGQRVFYTEDPGQRWDGFFKGVPAELGVYMYYLRYTPNPDYPEHAKKGDVTLVR